MLGKELIANEIIALVELIKNSYDADATIVVLTFNFEEQSIEINDNGLGMTLDDIKQNWMVPATDVKLRSVLKTSKFKRPILGEKGIGRFAAARIGNHLSIITQKESEKRKIKVNFDWNEFSDGRFLKEIRVKYDVLDSEDINDHGVRIKISDLNTDDLAKLVNEIHEALTRLTTTIEERQDDFFLHINIIGNTRLSKRLSGKIEPSEILEQYRYRIMGDITGNGDYTLDIEIGDLPKEPTFKGTLQSDLSEEEGGMKKDNIRNCGPFRIDLKVWDRDPPALRELKDILRKKSQREVSNLLDASCGIGIYRDGFRLYPYGETGFDWLELNKRRVNNPTLRLSSNQISGNVFISRRENPELNDKADRQGIIDSEFFETFKRRIKEVFVILEPMRFDYRRNVLLKEEGVKTKTDLLVSSKLDNFEEVINELPIEFREKLLKEYNIIKNQIDQDIIVVKRLMTVYRRLTSLGAFVDESLHNIRPHIGTIRNKSKNVLDTLKNQESNNKIYVDSVKDMKSIIEANREINNQIEYLDPLSGGKRSSIPSSFSIQDICKSTYHDIIGSTRKKYRVRKDVEISLSTLGEEISIKAIKGDWILIFQNLIDNSVFWSSSIRRKVELELVTNSTEKEIAIIFRDNGPGINENHRDLIFVPYFTTKSDGYGLGLFIMKSIIEEMKGNITLSKRKNGATFEIKIPIKYMR